MGFSGRVIVLPEGYRELQPHEIFVDQHEAQWHEETGALTQRGSFEGVASSAKSFSNFRINCLFVGGAQERDTGLPLYTRLDDVAYENADASPFASPCRGSPCALLGGAPGFFELVQECHREGMKVVVDVSTRVSASHPHRHYLPLMLLHEDAEGKANYLYGGETRGIRRGETALLNYRKVASWNRFVLDVLAWIKKFGIDGVKLLDSATAPEVLLPNSRALSRRDADGEAAYSPEDIITGQVVVPGTQNKTGYWSLAKSARFYPNPFFVKLCRSVWAECPDFLVFAEAANPFGEGSGNLPNLPPDATAGLLSRSGLLPVVQQVASLVPPLLNGHGSVASLFKTLCKQNAAMPPGGAVLQLSCGPASPLPLLSYKRAAWVFQDLLCFLPDSFVTVAGELEGMIFRMGVPNFFSPNER
ncbi:glycogen synthase, putative, partial [Eimeria tenella]